MDLGDVIDGVTPHDAYINEIDMMGIGCILDVVL